ncbi:MAG: hypothetical protein LBO07_00940 [Coriobacteriales bacterium]|jgi:hypothetical protein|nr:hypothetical protein [Coriobacteriales bacterium]
MANLEGWHIDPDNRRQFRYHDGVAFTGRTTTDLSMAAVPLGLFGKRFFSVKAELAPLLLGIMAVLGWLFWYLAGALFGIIALWLGFGLLRIGRTGLLITGMVLAGVGLLLSLGFWAFTLILVLA